MIQQISNLDHFSEFMQKLIMQKQMIAQPEWIKWCQREYQLFSNDKLLIHVHI